jgi:phage-related baseplate assembly protein
MSNLPVELRGLPEPQVIQDISFETMLADLIGRFKMVAAQFGLDYDVDSLETDPAIILGQAFSFQHVQLRQRINEAVKAMMLPYAVGADLDVLANFYDVTRLVGETDIALRQRVVIEIKGRSAAGPADRYAAVALAVDADIRSVSVFTKGKSPVVYVAILTHSNGGVPSSFLLADVRTALNDKGVRVVSDRIEVIPAVKETVDVELKIWLLDGAPDTIVDQAPDALRLAWAERGGLGRDLTHSWIEAELMTQGVYRIELVDPVSDVVVDPNFAIALGNISVELVGRGY